MSKSWVPILILFLGMFSMSVKAQDQNIYEGLSLKGSAGLAAMHGDITMSPFGQLSDAKLGFSINGIKMFNPFIGIQVRYFGGNLSATRSDLNQQYTGHVSEIGLAIRIEPLRIMGQNGPRKVYPYTRFGISSTSFRAIRLDTNTGLVIPPSFGYKLDNETKGPQENALSFPISLGLGYRINDKISLEIEHSNSITNNDNLDAWAGSSNINDMIGFTNIGIRYNLGSSGSGTSGQTSQRRTKDLRTSSRSSRNRDENRKLEDGELPEDIEIAGAVDPFDYNIPITTVFVESRMPDNPSGGKMFEVNLLIHKNDFKGSATITQNFPPGFTVLETPLRHAELTFINQQLKIKWSQMPADSVVTVLYHVHISKTTSGKQTISGNIRYTQPEGSAYYNFNNYLLVSNRREADMDSKFLNIVKYNEPIQSDHSNSVIISDPISLENEKALDLKIEKLLNLSGELNDNMEFTTPSVSSYKPGIEFRIQCGAFLIKGEQNDLIRKHNIREAVKEEYHQGKYKYTVGSLQSYEAAKRWRDAFIKRTNLLDVFIVVYRDGVRLNSVNEVRR